MDLENENKPDFRLEPQIEDDIANNQSLKSSKVNKRSNIDQIKRRWEKICNYKDDRYFVFFIGQPQASKTTILVALYDYLRNIRGAWTNPEENSYAVKFIHHQISLMSEGKFPPPTGGKTLIDFDVKIHIKNEDIEFTFLEFAGEDLALFDPYNQSSGDSTFFENFKRFFNSNPQIIFFLVSPVDQTVSHFNLFHALISRIKRVNEDLTNNVGLIISKWDKVEPKSQNLESFVQDKFLGIKLLLGEQNKFYKAFDFSIGRVIQNTDGLFYLNERNDKEHCKKILEWIEEVAIDGPVRRKVEETRLADEKLENDRIRKIKEIIGEKEKLQKKLKKLKSELKKYSTTSLPQNKQENPNINNEEHNYQLKKEKDQTNSWKSKFWEI